MTDLPSHYITVISLPAVSDRDAIVQSARWFQEYVAVSSPKELTGTMHFVRDTLTTQRDDKDILSLVRSEGPVTAQIDLAFLGRKSDFMDQILPAMVEGLDKIFDRTQIEDSIREGTLLDAVTHWTGTSSLSQLISSFSLPPLHLRSHRRCKGSSLLAFSTISDTAIHTMIDSLRSGYVTHAQWKPYGGRNVLHPYSIWDSRSPLRRGHQIEIHFSACYKPNAHGGDNLERYKRDLHTTRLQISFMDADLVTAFSGAIQRISENFPDSYPHSFPAYVDIGLPNPGRSYFGTANAKRLSQIRMTYGPPALQTRAGSAFYPMRHSFVFVGSGSDKISTYSINYETGKVTFVTQMECAHPSWLSFSPRGDSIFAVSRDPKASNTGHLLTYQIQPNGHLTKAGDTATLGKGPTHISGNSFHSSLYVSHGGGNISVLTKGHNDVLHFHQILSPNLYTSMISSEENFLEAESRIQKTARSADIPRPFIHQVVSDPHSNYLIATDFYRDCLYVLKRDTTKGRLIHLYSHLLPAHTGPRHLAFHPLYPIFFVLGEMSNNVTSFLIHRDTGDTY